MLIPLGIGILLLLGIFIGAETLRERAAFDSMRDKTLKTASEAFTLAVERDTDKLSAVLEAITRDAVLQAAYLTNQREELLAVSKPLFEGLRKTHDITHFYFIDHERRMYLRVQSPERFGDPIVRQTVLRAERSGRISAGLELGPLGVFTLRVVSPWRDQAGALLGYIELGIEIDSTLSKLHQLADIDLYMFIDKRFLDRGRWEDGMRMVGRRPEWDRFSNHVLIGTTRKANDALLSAYYPTLLGGEDGASPARRMQIDGRELEMEGIKLSDAGGRIVGTMLVAMDFTDEEARQRLYQAEIVGAALLVGLLLILIANQVLNHVYSRLLRTRDERDEFLEKAERDGLTGLYRQDVFFRAIRHQIVHARPTMAEFALLMIDVDLFKQVNDTHGHLTGDLVLQGVAGLILDCVRPGDTVARYGGEEFAVILPRMPISAACVVAERIRSGVEAHPFANQSGTIQVTVSIGIAVWPENGDDEDTLINAADAALYAAKRAGRNRALKATRMDVCQRE